MYGVIKAGKKGSYIGKVPELKAENGYKSKYFGYTKFSDPYEAACAWVNITGIEIWGWSRWVKIREGKLTRMRNATHSVTVGVRYNRYTLSDGCIVERPSHVVRWYNDEGLELTRWFGYRDYGDNAEVEANLFASKKRAQLTGGELSLPILQFASPKALSSTVNSCY